MTELSKQDLDRIEQTAKEKFPVEMHDAGYGFLQDLNSISRTDYIDAATVEASHWQAIVEHLYDTLHIERTGLAKALAEVVKTTERYRWITEGRGPYAYNDDEYRKEAGYMLDAIEKLASDALTTSGAIAHNECCKRGIREITVEGIGYVKKEAHDSTIQQQQQTIQELVEGLEDALGSIDEDFYPHARGRVRSLINKHKKS